MDAELIAHDPVEPPADPPPAPVQADGDAPPPPPEANLDADAAIDAEVDSTAIDVDGTEKLVPLSAVTKLRERNKTLKTEAARVRELEQQAQQYQQQWQQAQPYIQAAQALLAAKQMGPQGQPQPAAPEPQDDTEALELAQALDLYKPDGTPDTGKAKKILATVDKRAKGLAQESVAPVLQHTAHQQSQVMLARAKATKAPNGEAPDPAILDQLWASSQPTVTTSPEGAKWLWTIAYGLSSMNKKGGQAPAVPPPDPPLYTEKAGGQDAQTYRLNDGDRRLARDLGLTDAQFAKQIADMPWGKK